jgi:hypothetical protein
MASSSRPTVAARFGTCLLTVNLATLFCTQVKREAPPHPVGFFLLGFLLLEEISNKQSHCLSVNPLTPQGGITDLDVDRDDTSARVFEHVADLADRLSVVTDDELAVLVSPAALPHPYGIPFQPVQLWA